LGWLARLMVLSLPKDTGHPSPSVKYGNLRIVRAIQGKLADIQGELADIQGELAVYLI
jgi:hypothetical protein